MYKIVEPGGLTFGHTVGYKLEQNTVYFLITPFSLSGGSQETYTTELDAAAAFTPPGGPGTRGERKNYIYIYLYIQYVYM